MAGWLANGVQTVGAITVNGVVQTIGGLNFNSSFTPGGVAPPYTQLGAAALVSADTEVNSGSQPQTVAATAFQIAAHAAGLAANTATSTAGAATLNTKVGRVTTEALSTAVGATYTFTLTNSLITATGPVPQVMLLDGTNTAGVVQLTSITNGAGSSVFVFTNVGTAAFNGTMQLAFHV